MENHSFSSYPDSGDSSPRSREIVDSDNPSLSWDEPAAAKVKLMCSYGGRIQPRHHDNQLSYVGGETKILAVERSIRFPAFAARLAAILPAADDVCFKYQLPGEDLDALISITNDEDLDHMMLEYDRLLRPAARPAPRLRLFLFPLALSPSAPEQKSDGQWFVDALNSAPAQPEPTPAVAAAGPDFLFGLDSGFVPPPAIKVKDPSPPPPTAAPPAPLAPALEPVAVEPIPSEAPVKDERQIGAEAVADIQRQIKDLQKLQIAAENQQAAVTAAADFYMPRAPEKVAPAQMSPAYWPDQRVAPAGSRYASIVGGGDQPLYMFPGPYPGGAYYAALPRMVPAEMYAMGPPAAVAKGTYAEGVARSGALPVTAPEAQGFGVAYDSAGRAVYYTGSVVPTYQTMASVGPVNPVVEASKVAKPPQVS